MTKQLTLFMGEKLFEPGHVYVTRNALDMLDPIDTLIALGRHGSGDWDNVCAEDAAMNDEALREGYRLMSVYTDRHGTPFWIITEADRSVTTVLLPDDY